METEHRPSIVIVGATSLDRVRLHPNLEEIQDGKFRAEHSYSAVGGGGANVAISLKEIGNLTGQDVDVTLFTKIGREAQDYDGRHEAYKKMQSTGIDVRDLVANQDHRIDENTVISFSGGRFVSLQEKFDTAKSNVHPLSAQRKLDTPDIDPGAEEMVLEAVKNADLVIVTHHYPKLSEMAATAARDAGVPVMMDYPVQDPERAKQFKTILSACDYIVAPAEARLPDMQDENYKNGGELFVKLTERYPEAFIAVSDGTNPVHVFDAGKEAEVEVTRFPLVDQLGTGDARTGAMAFYIANDDEPMDALVKASRTASFSVQFPGRTWLSHYANFMGTDPIMTGLADNDNEEIDNDDADLGISHG